MKEQLTQEELKMLIDIVSRVTVQVSQVQPFVEIINKLSRMIDQLEVTGD